jgi:hypothetical protein
MESESLVPRTASLAPVLSQMNQGHTFTHHFIKMQFNIILPSTSVRLPSDLFPSGFPE